MYLWKRSGGFTFQQRIPSSLKIRFGTSPLRVNLGPISAATAKKRAFLLAAESLRLMESPTMTREILLKSLSTLAQELKSLDRERFGAGLGELRAMSRIADAIEEGDVDFLPALRREEQVAIARKREIELFRDRLGKISGALSSDAVAWEAERATYESVVSLLGRIEHQIAAPAPPIAVEADSEHECDERAFKPTTLLSVAGRSILDARKAALNPDDKDGTRYEERLETAFTAFLEVIGDKPLRYYLPIHMQDFATILARVPANRSKIKSFKGMTLKEMGEANSKLPADQRRRCLSETTVGSYLSEVKNIWSRVAAGVPGLRDMGAYKVTMPTEAEEAIDRDPLLLTSVNLWLRSASESALIRKPHKVWLPLVGLLTGMRLAELVYLQKADIVDVEGNEVLDLRLPLWIDGQEVDRPVKTKASKRIVAIHPLLRETGFVEYMKTCKTKTGFVFDRFHSAEDPADAAQKQMSNDMHGLGIHMRQRQVFHSLRHNAKDWVRSNVGDRLADKQCGHALNGTAANYGAKLLTPPEVRLIMSMPAPEGVDFSPFISRR
ncbi:hypothetical protein [Rhizobium sullae]|uniref:hypothetical protein n=1 Tax=Rhizobium sullae TaxID=50338 RepID=UPI000B34F722|nr:hypothetical protein [Rhizobium sullae]